HHRDLHAAPTRRSSDLDADKKLQRAARSALRKDYPQGRPVRRRPELRLYEGYARPRATEEQATAPGTVFSPHLIVRTLERETGPDRKSTRLNSSHVKIS